MIDGVKRSTDMYRLSEVRSTLPHSLRRVGRLQRMYKLRPDSANSPFKKKGSQLRVCGMFSQSLAFTRRSTALTKSDGTHWSDLCYQHCTPSVAASVPILSTYDLPLVLEKCMRGTPSLVYLQANSSFLELPGDFTSWSIPCPFPSLFPSC